MLGFGVLGIPGVLIVCLDRVSVCIFVIFIPEREHSQDMEAYDAFSKIVNGEWKIITPHTLPTPPPLIIRVVCVFWLVLLDCLHQSKHSVSLCDRVVLSLT